MDEELSGTCSTSWPLAPSTTKLTREFLGHTTRFRRLPPAKRWTGSCFTPAGLLTTCSPASWCRESGRTGAAQRHAILHRRRGRDFPHAGRSSLLEMAHLALAPSSVGETLHTSCHPCTPSATGVALLLKRSLRESRRSSARRAIAGTTSPLASRGLLTRMCSSSKRTSKGILSATSGIFVLGGVPPDPLILVSLFFDAFWLSLALQDWAQPTDHSLGCCVHRDMAPQVACLEVL